MSNNTDKITSLLEKVKTTDELITILNVVREYTLVRLNAESEKLKEIQKNTLEKIDKLNIN